METRGELRIDPGTLVGDSPAPTIELAVLYTEPVLAEALLRHAVALTAGLDATIHLVAVHAVPYPRDFECPSAIHAHLVQQLIELASHCARPVHPVVVLARSREEGFQFALHPESTVLVGSRRRLMRTAEEKLARALAHDGHKVALVHIA
ncbi:MAG TPA: hypothetical protein VG456_22270 [Candidatus Sulfopaludibacter sp.]|jgi:hypothetical protein|nr:hypothetical protein [Candidatus Sulfopaludibacter sp.]